MTDAPPPAATVRIGGGGSGPLALTALIAGFLALVILKPWAFASTERAQGREPNTTPPPATRGAELDGPADLGSHCDRPNRWRIYTSEGRNGGTPFRVWWGVEPASIAARPTDPKLPLTKIGSTIEAVGYCAPATGNDAPPPGVGITAWRLEAVGSPEVSARIVPLIAVAPLAMDPQGALYRPALGPAGNDPSEIAPWPAGRYVFALRGTSWERWWAVEISQPAVAGPPSPLGSDPPLASPTSTATARAAPTPTLRPTSP